MSQEPLESREQHVASEVIGSASDALYSALQKLRNQKSDERTARDRHVAIAITDLEKLIAFVAMYC